MEGSDGAAQQAFGESAKVSRHLTERAFIRLILIASKELQFGVAEVAVCKMTFDAQRLC
jgi:hypothetical protein